MKNINLIKKNFHLLLFISFYLSLFYSFYLNEDGTGRGASGDFYTTYPFIISLKKDLLANPIEHSLVHTPLHFIIMSFLDNFFSNKDLLRLFYCSLTIMLPIFFYLSLNELNFFKQKKNLLILSSIIFIMPAFRYTAIWATDLVTSLIFFQISILFFLKWMKNKTKNIDSNVFFQIIFLALATYCRQYFAVFFAYFLFIYYYNLTLKSFINLFIICIFTSLPVLFYAYLFPGLVTEQHISISALNYVILGNSSMLSVYLFPIFFLNFIFKQIKFDKKLLFIALLSFLIVFLVSILFKPVSFWIGAGIMYKLSRVLFENNLLFYFTSFFTIFIFIYFIFENKKNIILILILIFVFFSFQVYQRYYEPMFFLIFFTIIETNMKNIFFRNEKACYLLVLYYLVYYLGSVTDIIYKI